MRRAFLLGLGLLVAGCGGSSSGFSTVSTDTTPTSPTVTTPVAVPTSGPGQLVVPVFGGAQVATLALTNTPTTEFGGSAVNATITASVTAAQSRELTRRPAHLATRTAATTSRHYQQLSQGSTSVFYVSNTNLNVTCQKVLAESQTVHCTIFAEVVNGSAVLSTADAQRIATAWDSNNPFHPGSGVYDQVRATFGSEWTTNPAGGADGDSKINLLVLSSSSVGGASVLGYFNADDEFPQPQLPTSNEGEILYLNASYVTTDFFKFLATTAHEFQHCISWNQKVGQNGLFAGTEEDTSIDEGKSTLAEDLCGFGLTAPGGGSSTLYNDVLSYLSDTETPFFQFDQTPRDYGKSYLLMRYLYDRFGAAAFTAMATSPSSGLNNLSNSFGVPFSTVFQNWAVANLVSPLQGTLPAQFTYSSGFNPAGTYTINGLGTVTLPGIIATDSELPPVGSLAPSIAPWLATYIRYAGGSGGALVVDFSAGLNANLVVQQSGALQSVQ